MASVNKWIGIGRAGKDCELRYMPSGDAMASVSIACEDSYKDKSTGEKKSITEWVNLTFFGKLGEIAGEYIKKGTLIYVEGKLKTRKSTDKEGIERYMTGVKVDVMQLLSSKQGGAQNSEPSDARRATGKPASHQQRKPAPDFSDMDDPNDPPF